MRAVCVFSSSGDNKSKYSERRGHDDHDDKVDSALEESKKSSTQSAKSFRFGNQNVSAHHNRACVTSGACSLEAVVVVVATKATHTAAKHERRDKLIVVCVRLWFVGKDFFFFSL